MPDDSDRPPPPRPRLVSRPDPRREPEVRPPGILPARLEEELTTDLRRYLKESRDSIRIAQDDRVEIRGEIKEARRQLANLATMYTLHDQKDEARHLEVTGMLKGHEARMVALEKDQEDTGSWVRTHGGRLVREEKKRQWWTTRIAKLGFKVAEWAIIAALAWTLGHFVWR